MGLTPGKGFELILAHYGTCSAISAFEHLPSRRIDLPGLCADRLVKQLHEHLVSNFSGPRSLAGASRLASRRGFDPRASFEDRDWLFSRRFLIH